MLKLKFSKHALEQMEQRGISEDIVLEITGSPQQAIPDGLERMVYQSIKYFEKDKKEFLVRVIVNIIKQPNLIITVYRTSKIEKYWQNED